MQKRLENFLRLRYTVPLLIFSAISLSLVSEITYERAVKTLSGGIALTDARLGSARLLQLLTDAETAQRGYLLTGNAAYIEPLRNAQREFESSVRFLEFMADIGPNGREDAKKIYTDAAAKFAELQATVTLSESGKVAEALAAVKTDNGKRLMDDLRSLFDRKFTEAAALQQHARDNIYTALWFNRSAVAILSWLVALGLYLHLRQIRRVDRERNERQQFLEKAVAEQTLELRALAGYLQTVREDEKSHLARELHDELGGLLTAAKLSLARMRAKLSQDAEMLERIEQVSQHLSLGIALKRRIVEDLRPSTLSALGLNAALTILCAEAEGQLGVNVTTRIAEVELTPDAELGIFRLVQEALTNIGKYAHATQVSVSLQHKGGDLHLEVADNGSGFNVATLQPGQHGLAGMRFRMASLGGSLTVISGVGQGTRIVASLPSLALARPASPD